MVVLKTEVIDKAKSCVDIAVSCAQLVDLFGPVGAVGYVILQQIHISVSLFAMN